MYIHKANGVDGDFEALQKHKIMKVDTLPYGTSTVSRCLADTCDLHDIDVRIKRIDNQYFLASITGFFSFSTNEQALSLLNKDE